MAEPIEDIAIIAVDIITTLVSEAVDQGLSDEIIASLTEIQSTISDDLITAVNQDGLTVNEALTDSYNELYAINEDLANEFATQMAEKGEIPFEPSPEEAQEADFEDTDPDSDPNKGESNTLTCAEDPTLPECIQQGQSKLSSFFKWLIGTLGVAGIAAVIGAIIYFIGGIIIWVCKIFNPCPPPTSPPTSPTQVYTDLNSPTALSPSSPSSPPASSPAPQCGDAKCLGNACKSAKAMIQTIRKYMPFIFTPVLVLGLFIIIYFRSFWAFVGFGLVWLFLILSNGILGNFIASVICNFNASYCFFTGQDLNC